MPEPGVDELADDLDVAVAGKNREMQLGYKLVAEAFGAQHRPSGRGLACTSDQGR